MGPGRPRKLAEVKILEGTYRKDREIDNPAQPDLLADIPQPPEGLAEFGCQQWHVVCRFLHDNGQLATTDIMLIAAYCNECDCYWEYDRQVKSKGAVQKYYNAEGDLVRAVASPWTGLRNQALANVNRLAAQLALPPAIRSRLQSNKPQKPKSKLESLMKRR